MLVCAGGHQDDKALFIRQVQSRSQAEAQRSIHSTAKALCLGPPGRTLSGAFQVNSFDDRFVEQMQVLGRFESRLIVVNTQVVGLVCLSLDLEGQLPFCKCAV